MTEAFFPRVHLLLTVTHVHTRVYWACNVQVPRSQNQLIAIIMCYQPHQLIISSSFRRFRTLSFPPSSPSFWSRWRGGQAEGAFSFLQVHISQCHRVTHRERAIQSDVLSIIITVLLMLVRWLGDPTTLTATSADLSSRFPHVCQFLARTQKIHCNARFCF